MDQLLEFARRLGGNLAGLGSRRLLALGLAGLLVAGATILAGYRLSRPPYETLYAGLDRQDASRIAAALREAGLAFDVGGDGQSVMVRYGEAARARMILAERGLPGAATAGYELFDKLGSLGLTSFMQEVTRLRAIEGELARTIQLMAGVRAARVHLVLGEEGSFRRAKTAPTASVIIRVEHGKEHAIAQAIRRLVAAAVPGMAADHVTVLGADGAVLASSEDGADAAPTRLRQLEAGVAREIEDRIRRTLAPHLAAGNFQVSVDARVNADRRQTEETTYNPDSRVERSVRVTKETLVSQNNSQTPTASVERNLPQDRGKAGDGKQSSEENQKREELTNYELSSKRVTTVSAGYAIEHLSIAVVVNRAGLRSADGKPEAALEEIGQLVASASGLRRERGDALKVSAVDFVAAEKDFAPAPAATTTELLVRHAGSAISGLAAIVVVALVLLLGVRPLARVLASPPAPSAPAAFPALASDPAPALLESAAVPATPAPPDAPDDEFAIAAPKRTAREKLERIVAFDEALAATILRQWVREAA